MAIESSSSPKRVESSLEDEIQPVDNHASSSTSSPDTTTAPDPSSLDAARQPPETAAAAAQPKATDTPRIHSAFTQNQKRFIVAMVSLASFFSPLSGQIYFPVMPTLVKDYHLTNALVNLTITTYMILQGLAPSFMGTFADTGGRRPAYILAFTIYTAANIGLALQRNYPALMVLRCIQSAGSSGTVAFGYGVIADIATPAERGTYTGPMAGGIMVAPALGPVIGGILSKYLGWRSVFWFLVIISGGYLVLFVLAVPETARKIVGDGSVLPKEWWRRSVIQWWQGRRHNHHHHHPTTDAAQDTNEPASDGRDRNAEETSPRRPQAKSSTSKLSFPNPLKSFAILLEKDALILIIHIGFVMLSNVAVMTSTPSLFAELYGFNDLQIGLCFLPLGISACIGSILNGKLLDYNYRRYARHHNLPLSRKTVQDLRSFPVEHARLTFFFPFTLLSIAAYLPYGWVLACRPPLYAPLILQFLIGFTSVASLNCLNTLMVDLFPDRPATAAAACNLVRCWLGALGAAVIDHMLVGMGWGWCFTFLGLVMAVSVGLVYVEYLFGMVWRVKRIVRGEGREREGGENAV